MSTAAAPIRSIAERWRELHGEDQWRGLLDPLDGDLRRSIICYGELEQATNDAFIREAWSPHAGACRYSRDRFLDKAGAWGPAGLYEVTAFFYATAGAGGVPGLFMARPPAAGWAWSRESNWMGYVTVATDAGVAALGRRDVVVAWRGTVRPMEWLNNLDFTLVSAAGVLGVAGDHRPAPRVHRGWLSIYTATDPASKYSKLSAREQILEEIKRLMDKYRNEDTSITVVGHSLGAAVATLNAADIVSNGLNRQGGDGPNQRARPVTAVAFACPRVGDAGFKKLFDELPGLRVLRVCNAPDVVPIYPPMGYVDVGVRLLVDTGRSPYLKSPGNQAAWHSLECYLHGVAGVQGRRGGFKLEVDRDVALVNKNVDALKEEYHVPPAWSVQSNKGMVRGADGHWKLMDHEEEEGSHNN